MFVFFPHGLQSQAGIADHMADFVCCVIFIHFVIYWV